MAQGEMGWGIYFSARLGNFSSTIYKRSCTMVLFCFVPRVSRHGRPG